MTAERFLITGALGCIGAWIVKTLVDEGATPVVFDRAADPRRLRLVMGDAALSQVQFVTGDITELAALEAALDAHAVDRVIHLAALQVPFCRADPPRGALVNVVGTVNVFEAVARRRDRIPRVVYASSAAVYDAADAGADGSVAHGASGHPATLYGVYKQANEGTARIYWLEKQLSSVGLRPLTVYGVGRDQGRAADKRGDEGHEACEGRHSGLLRGATKRSCRPAPRGRQHTPHRLGKSANHDLCHRPRPTSLP